MAIGLTHCYDRITENAKIRAATDLINAVIRFLLELILKRRDCG